DQKRCFDKIPAVVVPAEGYHVSRTAIHPMGPRPVETIGMLQKREYLFHPLKTGIARDKTAFHADNECHNSESRSTGGHNIAGRIALTRHPADGMCEIPKVCEGSLLHEC